jgi:cytochrome c
MKSAPPNSTLAAFLMLAAALRLAGAPQQPSEAENLMKGSDCSSCHALDRDVVGPAYAAIAKRYAGQKDALERLSAKIRDGGGGMTSHKDFTDAQRADIAAWILAQQQTPPETKAAGRMYSYTLKDSTTVQLDFPVTVEGQAPKVTKEVFHGYQLYNSYCYRCHGTDATGAQLAPDLRRTLAVGLKQAAFLSIAMEGKKEKGMPAWAGFLSEDDVVHIYRYVKGRSLDLVPVGRPPSEQD